MITTGVTGAPWRASINAWGGVEPWDGSRPLEWFVAADDRWHVPADEATVRQARIEGTAVTETRLRVPTGDVVQRIFSVADAGGLTVIEVENESTMPVAVAFSRRDLLTERPIAEVPIEGIDLPAEAFVLPLGHNAIVRVGMAHRGSPSLPTSLPSARQVVRGWLAVTERASRFVLPDGERGSSLAAAITGLRCELALGTIPRAIDDPVGYVVALGELVRMGEDPEHWLPELVDAIERIGPVPGWDGDVALEAAGRVLAAAGEHRARRDLARICAERSPDPRPVDPSEDVRAIPWLESSLARRGALLPDGLPTAWFGQGVEVYGVPTGDTSSVSFALRWHGERPALLWEQTGDTVDLTAPVMAPRWGTAERKGETLWPAPPGAPAIRPDADRPVGDEPERGPDTSFG